MTDYLEGNHITWGMENQFRTSFGSGVPQDFDAISYIQIGFSPQINNTQNMTLMSLAGKVQGIIAHVFRNTSFSPNETQFEFIKTEDNGTTFIPTGLKVVIPGGEKGFFYSNTDIAEFTRSWEKGEFVAIRKIPDPSKPGFAGIGPCTLMILLDIDN
jgi:hypothetical protein